MATPLRDLRALRGVASRRARVDRHDVILQLDVDIISRSSFVRLAPLAAKCLFPCRSVSSVVLLRQEGIFTTEHTE